MRRSTVLVLMVLSISRIAESVETVRFVTSETAGPILERIADIASRAMESRFNLHVVRSGDAPLVVELATDDSLPPEGFEIADRDGGGVLITGADDHSVMYGLGKFLRTSRFDEGGFAPSPWRGTSAPEGSFRAIYAATHFNNFYEAAPAEEVSAYIEELALWGANTVIVHFPTWSFTGFDDPEALRNLEQTQRLLRAAKAIGMKAGLVQCPNQRFTTAPQAMRAAPNRDESKRRGNMGVNCCPSTPEGMAYLRGVYTQLFQEYRDIGLDYLICWPYDEGGCGCETCAPWGAKAFPELSKNIAAIGRETFPEMKVILSTWVYDVPPSGEWEGLSALLESNHAWLDGIMCDDHFDFPRYPLDHGVPAGLPLYNFPEISMWGRGPWGAFGANPLPARYERLWKQVRGKVSGGMPYSEGIFEDINKAICFQFYWNRDVTAEDTLREYAAYEFAPAVADLAVEAVRLLESTWEKRGPESEEAFRLLERADAMLSPRAKTAWRWRILYLRGLIDSQIVAQSGKIEGEALREAFEELTTIYHAENAHGAVKPPAVP